MKNKEQLEERLIILKKCLKDILDSRIEYVQKQISVSSLKAKIELLEWILN